MRLSILGKTWNLRWVRKRDIPGSDGECDAPNAVGKEIRIVGTLGERRRRTVLIHEMLHAADWWRDEEWITRVAEDIERALWRVEQNGG